MGQSLSRHLWNAAILAGSASVALAAERIGGTNAGSRPATPVSSGTLMSDVGEFVRPQPLDTVFTRLRPTIQPDPFETSAARAEVNIASQGESPTVSSGSARGAGLTAILVSDDRRVAVIDDATVAVGDVLRDGSRVSAIQPDRVYVVERNGRWRTLTLTHRGTR